MPRLVALVLALALVTAACGSGTPDAGSTAATEAAPDSTAPADSSDPTPSSESSPSSDAPTASSEATEPPVSGVDGPSAPPDAVPFEGGNDIDLSQEVLPVYLVFWAEW